MTFDDSDTRVPPRQSVRWSQSRAKLAAARAKAQESVRHALKKADNPFFKSRYADLAEVSDACLSALATQEIAVFQAPWSGADGSVGITTSLVHSSGEWVESDLSARPKDNGPQAMGSVLTYLRRYSLAALAGVATDDDDAESSEGRGSASSPSSGRAEAGPRTLTPSESKAFDFDPGPLPDWKAIAEKYKRASTHPEVRLVDDAHDPNTFPAWLKSERTKALKRADDARSKVDPKDDISF